MSIALRKRLTDFLADSPLRNGRFRSFYIGATGTAIGYTMQATIAAWLMASLTPSPLMVALVQTASTLPALLVGLVAGALADLIDRRRIILASQLALVVASIVLGLTAITGTLGPATLLTLTFVIGAAFTLYMPAQQASVNDLVVRAELPRALAAGAASFNIARAIGPALAGGVAAAFGSGAALIAAGLFFLPMFTALRGWKPRERHLPGLPETISSGVLSGLRYARHSQPLVALLTRTLVFSFCASSFWSLLPVIARDDLGVGAGGFGLVSAVFGAGAIVGALQIPRQLAKHTLEGTVTRATWLWAGAMALAAATDLAVLVVIGACIGGFAWVSVLASISTGLQSATPAWVRARAVAMNLVTMQTCLALGSAIWGVLASATTARIAIGVSAGLLVLLHIATRRQRLDMGSDADVTTGVQLPELAIVVEPDHDDGPILVQLAYQIDRDRRTAFLNAIQAMEPIRRRNGATSWRVFRDLEEDGRFVERFILGSYGEYMRLRARMTQTDLEAQEAVDRLQRPGVPIKISRLIGVDPE